MATLLDLFIEFIDWHSYHPSNQCLHDLINVKKMTKFICLCLYVYVYMSMLNELLNIACTKACIIIIIIIHNFYAHLARKQMVNVSLLYLRISWWASPCSRGKTSGAPRRRPRPEIWCRSFPGDQSRLRLFRLSIRRWSRRPSGRTVWVGRIFRWPSPRVPVLWLPSRAKTLWNYHTTSGNKNIPKYKLYVVPCNDSTFPTHMFFF